MTVGVGGQEQQFGIMAPHAAGAISAFEERRGPGDQRTEGRGQPGGRRGPEAAHLPQQPEELGAPRRQAEHGPDNRLHPAPTVGRPVQGSFEDREQLGRGPVYGGVEKRLLGRAVVQDRLLANAELPGESIETGGVVPPGTERHDGGVDARGLGCWRWSSTKW